MLSASGQFLTSSAKKTGGGTSTKGPQFRGLMSSIGSFSDETWSRGSLYEKQFLDASSLSSPPPPPPKSESLYQYEYGGIVVFDSKAHIPGDGFPVSPPIAHIEPRRKFTEIPTPDPDRKKFLSMKHYSPFPTFESDYELKVPPDALRFESRFESGNLRRAIRRLEREYYLVIQEDTESRGHTQWFYFAVRNRKPGTYKFQIINLYKDDSLYNEGMLPVVLSMKQSKGWHYSGRDVSYQENSFPLPSKPMQKSYTLSFTYDFMQEDDTVYFAHSVPYTYTELSAYLRELKSKHPSIVRVDPMCQTLAGNVCEVLTITSSVSTYRSFHSEALEWGLSAAGRKAHRSKQDWDTDTHKNKKAIVLTARVHPGETPGSFLLRGAIDFLVSSSPVTNALLSNFVFKIIPMLNPDGVRYGNYRCSVLGVDLNRRWRSPSRTLHPTIYFAKRLIQTLGETHEIALFCDMHGHSCKRNAFLYGCSQVSTALKERKRNVVGKVLPLLLCDKNRGVAWKQCHFGLDRWKEATARVVVYSEFEVGNSYTLEASFYGPDTASVLGRKSAQFLVSDYEQIGKDLIEVSLCFASQDSLLQTLARVPVLLGKIQNGESVREDNVFALGTERNRSENGERCEIVGETERSEDAIWEQLLEIDEKLTEITANADSDSSCSEESEEEQAKTRKIPTKSSKPIQKYRLRSSEIKVFPPKVVLKEPQSIGNVRKPGFLDGSPKLFRSHRAVGSKSPPGVVSNRAVAKAGFRVNGEGRVRKSDPVGSTSPSRSTQLLTSLEPLVIATEPSLRPQASFTKFLPRVPIRSSSMKRYHLNDSLRPVTVMEYVRKAIKGGRVRPMRCGNEGETEKVRMEIMRKSLQVQSRALVRREESGAG